MLGEFFSCEYCELFDDNTFHQVYYCALHKKYLNPLTMKIAL
jgi:hypothetical protein